MRNTARERRKDRRGADPDTAVAAPSASSGNRTNRRAQGKAVQVHLWPEELDALKRAAHRRDLSLSRYVITVLQQAARVDSA